MRNLDQQSWHLTPTAVISSHNRTTGCYAEAVRGLQLRRSRCNLGELQRIRISQTKTHDIVVHGDTGSIFTHTYHIRCATICPFYTFFVRYLCPSAYLITFVRIHVVALVQHHSCEHYHCLISRHPGHPSAIAVNIVWLPLSTNVQRFLQNLADPGRVISLTYIYIYL